jgi:prepilin peptidase CpaA
VIPAWHIATLVSLLAIAGASDLARRRVPNVVTLAIAGGGAAAAWVGAAAPRLPSALGAALALGAILIVPWRAGVLGGGDVKLAGAAATWFGFGGLTRFAFATALAGGLLSVCCLVVAVRRRVALARSGRCGERTGAAALPRSALIPSVPYGVAIAFGTLFAVWRAS